MSVTEDKGQASRVAGGIIGEEKSMTEGALRQHNEYASLREELEKILLEFGEKPGAVRGPAAETGEKYAPARYGEKQEGIVSAITGAILFVAIAAFFAGVFLYRPINSGPRDIFGLSAMIMPTNSMQSEIPKDSLIVTRRADPQTIRIGDDITFSIRPELVITHRVVGIHEQFTGAGARGFETKGIDNARADREIVPAPNVIGKVIFHSEGIGRLIILIRQNLMLTAIAAVLIIAIITVIRYLTKTRAKGSSIWKT